MEKSFISGHFNILHSGHLRLFRFAKNKSKKLIIGLYVDPQEEDKYLLPLKTRLEVLKNCNLVDQVTLIRNNLLNVIKKIKPDLIIKGSEFRYLENLETQYTKNNNSKLLFSSGEKTIIKLPQSNLNNNNNLKFDKNYLSRNKISKTDLIKTLSGFKNKSVCVIGDIIVDDYSYHEALGMSQEDSSIVVKPIETSKYLGGAGIVAAHSAKLGAKSFLISVVGNDREAIFAKNKLKEYGVKNLLLIDNNRITTLKKKIKLNDKTLLRINDFTHEFINKNLQNKIYDKIKSIIKQLNLLIFSDFNYGVLPSELINKIVILCKKNNVLTSADSQLSSQIGDITRFKEIDLISQTEFEMRSSLKNSNDGLVEVMSIFRKINNSKNLFMKLGEQGLIINHYNKNNDYYTDKLDSINSFPVDTAGAGDSMLVSSSLSLCVSNNIWQSAFIANLVAAIQISRVGNTPISFEEVKSAISNNF